MFVGGPGKQLTLYFSCSKHLWRLDYGVWLDLLFSLINTINAPSLNTSFTFCFLFFLQTTYQLMFLFAIKQNCASEISYSAIGKRVVLARNSKPLYHPWHHMTNYLVICVEMIIPPFLKIWVWAEWLLQLEWINYIQDVAIDFFIAIVLVTKSLR